MHKLVLILMSLMFATALYAAAEDTQIIRGTTEDGRQVVLKPNGTWSFSEQKKDGSTANQQKSSSVKPSSDCQSQASTYIERIPLAEGKMRIGYDRRNWEGPVYEEGRIQLTYSKGTGFATIMSAPMKGSAEDLGLNFAEIVLKA